MVSTPGFFELWQATADIKFDIKTIVSEFGGLIRKLEDIPVRVEFSLPKAATSDTVNHVLHEIHAALTELQANGNAYAIDLRQLPRMSPDIYQSLRDALMQGEVTAVIQAQVKVEVAETQYPGVWWLRHFNEREEITTEIIEVTEMPAILIPHRVDMLAGLQKLEERLHLGISLTEPTASAGERAGA